MRVKLLVKQLEVSEQWLLSLQKRSFYAGASLIESSEVTFAEVLRVFYGLVFTVNTLSRSFSLVPDSTKAKTGASSIFALLDRKSKIDSSDNSGMTLDNLKGNIEFQHVSFNYPRRPEAQVLKEGLAISSGQGFDFEFDLNFETDVLSNLVQLHLCPFASSTRFICIGKVAVGKVLASVDSFQRDEVRFYEGTRVK
ncbi:hypothetical protein BC332_14864 [Capsicum chinense]|nr:hypothetical protein BC332_14864 [Capsicum chinense]